MMKCSYIDELINCDVDSLSNEESEKNKRAYKNLQRLQKFLGRTYDIEKLHSQRAKN